MTYLYSKLPPKRIACSSMGLGMWMGDSMEGIGKYLRCRAPTRMSSLGRAGRPAGCIGRHAGLCPPGRTPATIDDR